MDASAETIPEALLGWYDAHARTLVWRSPPGSRPPEPYRVWLSEVMLQQTTAAAVARYFTEFTRRWPTLAALAAAEDAEVMAAWAGLGYYARARNLLACAREVAARGGEFPDTEDELRGLPGLGRYTAAAMAAIAFGRRAVVVDANVERVAARLFAIESVLPAGKPAIYAAAERITPHQRAGDFAQAMMDLGATICTPRAPRCRLCPLAAQCAGRRTGEPERYPVKGPKPAKPNRVGTACWISTNGKVWLVQRAGKGLLGGMRALPDDGWTVRADGAGSAPLAGSWRHAGAVSHGFTHFNLRLNVLLYLGSDWASLPVSEGEWWPLDRLDEAGLPTLFAKAAQLVLANLVEPGVTDR
jgi:A/G-specific adenine glycosylase